MKYEALEGAGELPNRHHLLFCVFLLVFSVSLSVLGSQFRSSPRFLLVRPVVQSRTDETDFCDLWSSAVGIPLAAPTARRTSTSRPSPVIAISGTRWDFRFGPARLWANGLGRRVIGGER